MENILQSIVKIIIIGTLYGTTEGNRQFLPPPLPYYQNENFYLPTFGPAYHEPLVFYRAQNSPPPISYQNVNSYSPPQLFHQNENYNPSQFSNPNLRYPVPHIYPQKPSVYETYKPQQNDFAPPQTIYKKPPVQTVSVDAPPKKPGFYTTNIIVKEETHPPFYQDDYKNYHEDDYTDTYSDEIPPPPEPCLASSPYRYFESPRPKNQKLPLCNPHFQPNFASGIYTVKMPITLLPSRFPPRVEELIQRIQNYFSTYTEKETPKPLNETTSTTTVQPFTETVSAETVSQPTVTTEQTKRNKTAEIEELSLEETNSQTETAPTVRPISETVTQKTIVVEIESEEEDMNKAAQKGTEIAANNATEAPHVTTQKPALIIFQSEESSETSIGKETTQKPTLIILESEESSEKSVGQTTTQKPALIILESEESSEKSIETTTEESEEQTHLGDVKVTSSSTEAGSKAEETNTVQPTNVTLLKVTDTNG